MNEIEKVLDCMVKAIVDFPESVVIEKSDSDNGSLYEISVAKEDVGKIIGKKGRIASALRTIAKASGAKNGKRVMVNVFNKPKE